MMSLSQPPEAAATFLLLWMLRPFFIHSMDFKRSPGGRGRPGEHSVAPVLCRLRSGARLSCPAPAGRRPQQLPCGMASQGTGDLPLLHGHVALTAVAPSVEAVCWPSEGTASPHIGPPCLPTGA